MKQKDSTWTKRSSNRYVHSIRKKQTWVWHLMLATIIFLCFNQVIRAQHLPISNTIQAVDAYLSNLESFGLSGSLLIGTKDKVLLKKDYGVHGTSQGIDPAYLVGSLTKQFTATAILFLEQEGMLKTSDLISDYLTNVPQDKSGITIHQLLTHTSGLKDDYWDRHRDLDEEAYVEMMLAKDMLSNPGERFSYANIGYHLLAKIVETVSKKDYERFLVEEFFLPNGLMNTGFKLVNWQKNQVVQYKDWTTEGNEHLIRNPLDRPIYLQPEGSGGIISTTRDLYKWYQTIFHSEKILSAVSRMKLLAAEKENYAYGWENYKTNRGTALIEHGGYDSWVGVVSGLYNFADENLVVIFLGNTHMSQFLRKEDLMNNIEALIFGGQVQMPPGSAIPQEEIKLSNYIGAYNKGESSLSVSKGITNNQLCLRTKDRVIIEQLLFPVPVDAEKRSDVQLEIVLNNIRTNNYEPLRDQLIDDVPFDVLKKMYSQFWVQNTVPKMHEGKFELELLLALKFERGIYYIRAFRNHNGRIHLQPLKIPEKLEIFLSPAGKDQFRYWNIKTGITSTVEFQKNGLKLNGNMENFYAKK